jgi:hypothetical protein
MEKQPDREQRTCYRVRYPRTARPILKIGSDCYEVVELSEGGLRFDHRARSLEDHAEVQGILCFRDGEQQEIEGAVIRRYGNETAMMLARGVTFGRMIREQQYVLSEYPRVQTD